MSENKSIDSKSSDEDLGKQDEKGYNIPGISTARTPEELSLQLDESKYLGARINPTHKATSDSTKSEIQEDTFGEATVLPQSPQVETDLQKHCSDISSNTQMDRNNVLAQNMKKNESNRFRPRRLSSIERFQSRRTDPLSAFCRCCCYIPCISLRNCCRIVCLEPRRKKKKHAVLNSNEDNVPDLNKKAIRKQHIIEQHLSTKWNKRMQTAVSVLRDIGSKFSLDTQVMRMLTDTQVPIMIARSTTGIGISSVKIFETKSDNFMPAGEWYIPASTQASPIEKPDPKKMFLKDKRVILYLHGGAMCLCSHKTHREMILRLADETQIMVLAIEYRRPPEHPWPTPVDDCYNAFKMLSKVNITNELHEYSSDVDLSGKQESCMRTNEGQTSPSTDETNGMQIHIAGDSAGGTLVSERKFHS